MPPQSCQLEAYVHTNGRCFIEEFLDDLTDTDRVYVDRCLQRLEEHGQDLPFPHAEYLQNHIHELRVRLPNRQARLLYFFFDHNRKAVLTHGVIKKGNVKRGNKLDPVEINKAIEYRGNFLTGKGASKRL